MPVPPHIKELVEKISEGPIKVGDIMHHPKHGRVKVVGGQFWGTYGVSNFWYWIKVDKHGIRKRRKKSGKKTKTRCGYGRDLYRTKKPAKKAWRRGW